MNPFERSPFPQESIAEKTEGDLTELKKRIALKEQKREEVTQEKIELIGKINKIEYSNEEKRAFDAWREKIPPNSMDEPIRIEGVLNIINFLPEVPNYTEGKVNLFFSSSRHCSEADLHQILYAHSRKNPSFEISVTQHQDNLISVGIGDKTRDKSMRLDGRYFGHYHPTRFILEKPEELPVSFVNGLMPSPGDVRGFLKNPDAIKEGTRIYSQYGYVQITPQEKFENPDVLVEQYKQVYFDLFLGVNKFGFTSNEDLARYFYDQFKMNLRFFWTLKK